MLSNIFSLSEITSLSQTDLESHLTSIYKTIYKISTVLLPNGNQLTITSSTTTLSSVNSLLNYLGYLGSICISPEVWLPDRFLLLF